ncbi:hypothetical protein NDU88_004470 [Pleurodeles waltl]|uniref:Transmembrane protein n=1 Tax=Pleurodeles waltl TaxID=8319 RepID=A0AAV7PCL3_PLEWA|nr:hypothetical protein NDU88_004470 [Pleurodeles waltl]
MGRDRARAKTGQSSPVSSPSSDVYGEEIHRTFFRHFFYFLFFSFYILHYPVLAMGKRKAADIPVPHLGAKKHKK